MNAASTILERITARSDEPAVFWRGRTHSYRDFSQMVEAWHPRLDAAGIDQGDVCGFFGEFSPQTCSLMIALIERKAILLPLTKDVSSELDDLLDLAGAKILIRFEKDDSFAIHPRPDSRVPELIARFRERSHPGILVFTSGSTGKPKGILQDVEHVSRKFISPRKGWKTPLFLLMDHFGGFNTFLSTFAYGGTAVCLPSRDPETVARTIQESRADLLPTTPTFLNYLIMSRQYGVYDLSSIKLITYGTEPMPEATLTMVRKIFPNAKLKQTYGLSELGVLRSESKNDGSLWLKIGGDGFETKIVDGILWIRSEANMVGYINAPNPFDEDGWMCTGDIVEEKDGYIRFLGRKSEVINTGGKKVFPVEVESALMQMDNVKNAAVEARPHPIMGQVVQARICLVEPEDPIQLAERLRTECNKSLARYKVPVRFIVVEEKDMHSARFKKIRSNLS